MVLAVAVAMAQAPEKFTYQAVLRNASNSLVANAPVGVRVSILQGGVNGTLVYMETQTGVTNANGLITLQIGGGNVQQGSLADIDWANGAYFLKTETDPNGGTNYGITSTQQMLSVPYALYSKEAGNGFSGDYNDLVNVPQIPQIPADVSAFNNDAGYITMADIQVLLDELNHRIDSLENIVNNLSPEPQELENGQPCSGASTLTDYDGNVYNTVQIGNQCWMKENLRSTHYSDGTAIAAGSVISTTVAYYYTPGGSFNYGYLYNWKAVMRNSSSSQANPSGVQGICPTGWHVPSDAEWAELQDYVGSQNQYLCSNNSSYIAKALAATTGWTTSSGTCAVGYNQSTNNATGFGALPAGYYSYYGYDRFGNFAYFWSATEASSDNAWYRDLYYNDAHVTRTSYDKVVGGSVRCLRD